MESHGLRLPPGTWRVIEQRARAKNTDRSGWLRKRIEALLLLSEDVHDESQSGQDSSENEELFGS